MAQTRIEADATPAQVAAILRERIYGGIACPSTLLVLLQHLEEDAPPWTAVVDVAIATGGLWAASLLADHVAHTAAHGRGPRGSEATAALRASGQICRAPRAGAEGGGTGLPVVASWSRAELEVGRSGCSDTEE